MSLSSPIVLLHGWAANHHIYDDFRQYLPTVPIMAPDLPGHGQDGRTVFDAQDFADELAARITEPVNLFAWSLGGQVALHLAARHPDKVASLCLCATFAKLLRTDDYAVGLVQSRLQNMATLFQNAYAQTMRQFLQLQILYTPKRRAAIDAILPALTQYPVPAALHSAQHYAQHADTRHLLATIQAPTLCVYGDKDVIAPTRLGDYLCAQLPHAQMLRIQDAVHTPFVSHPDTVVAALTLFWSQDAH